MREQNLSPLRFFRWGYSKRYSADLKWSGLKFEKILSHDQVCHAAYYAINPRPGMGGRCDPPEFFCDVPRTMRRIVLKFCTAYGTSFAQLLVKKEFDRVMSGHGAMTSPE